METSFHIGFKAAFWMKEKKMNEAIASYNTDSYSLEFYAASSVTRLTNNNSLGKFVDLNRAIIFINEKNLSSIDKDRFTTKLLCAFDFFHVSMLNLKFLNHITRSRQLEKIMLVSISKK